MQPTTIITGIFFFWNVILHAMFPVPWKLVSMIFLVPVFVTGPVGRVDQKAAAAHVHEPAQKAHRGDAAADGAGKGRPQVEDAGQKPAVAQQPLELVLNSDGSYMLAGKKLTRDELSTKLKAMAAATPQMRIELKADANTPHQMVTDAMKLCNRAGVSSVQFTTRPAAP